MDPNGRAKSEVAARPSVTMWQESVHAASRRPGQPRGVRGQPPVAPGARSRSGGPGMSEPDLRVLYAEDDVTSAQVISHLLSLLGVETHIAINGADAVEFFRDGIFGLVLMDLRMPILDGYEATRAIRAIEAEETRNRVPIIGITAEPDGARARSREAGIDSLLVKPVRFEALREVIEPLLPTGPYR